MGWEVRCDKHPEVFGMKSSGHGINPATNADAILLMRELRRYNRFRPEADIRRYTLANHDRPNDLAR